MLLVAMCCGGSGFVAAVGWLGEETVVGSCGWSVMMVAVGWWLVGSLMVCRHGVMGEKYIWMVVWDRRRRDLEGRARRASGGVESCEGVLCSIGV